MKYKVGDLLRYSSRYRDERLDCIIRVKEIKFGSFVKAEIIEQVGDCWNDKYLFETDFFEPYKQVSIDEFL